jgi:hypothetical protein
MSCVSRETADSFTAYNLNQLPAAGTFDGLSHWLAASIRDG